MRFLPDLVSAEKEDDRPSKKFKPDERFAFDQQTSSLLGLNLNKSSLRLIETKLNEQMERKEAYLNANQGNETAMANNAVNSNNSPRQKTEKLKALNFQLQKIVIGTWERISVFPGELVAKCYFAKKKLVWEILEKELKSKIEISWTDILAMNAEVEDNHPGILKIELGSQPSFYQEIDPQPRKHTQWKSTSDFTYGQASINRRHFLYFEPGVLEKQYEKLVQYGNELTQRSRIPFPTLVSSYFETRGFNFAYPFSSAPEVMHGPNFLYCVNQQILTAPAVSSLQFASTSQVVNQGGYPVQGFNQNYATSSTQFLAGFNEWDYNTSFQAPHTFDQDEPENFSNAYNSMQMAGYAQDSNPSFSNAYNSLQTAGSVQDSNPSFSNAYYPMQENLQEANAGWIPNVPDQPITSTQENSFASDEGRVQDGDFNFSQERNVDGNRDTTDHRPVIREIERELFDDSTFVGNSTGFLSGVQFMGGVNWTQDMLDDLGRGQF